MSHPRVLNMHHHGAQVPHGAVYVGRDSTGRVGPWGNPFSVAEHGRKALRLYLDHLAGNPGLVVRARAELGGKRLACWCAPAPCHAEVLARLADGEDLAEIRRDLLERVAETRDLFPQGEGS